jgi:hypothetical protein
VLRAAFAAVLLSAHAAVRLRRERGGRGHRATLSADATKVGGEVSLERPLE